MFTRQRQQIIDSVAKFSGTGILGTSPRVAVSREWPIEGFLLVAHITVGADITIIPATAQTVEQRDNLLGIVQKVNLSVNDGNQRSVVDYSGAGLLEYASQTGINLSAETLQALYIANGGNVVGGVTKISAGNYQVVYPVMCADMNVGEPLRSRLYLPAHKMGQDPVLTISFNNMAGLGMSVGTITAFTLEVLAIRRTVTADSESALAKIPTTRGDGYINWDLIETPTTFGIGVGGTQKIALATPGEYCGLMIRQYAGGANVTRNVIDSTGIGDTPGRGFGAEDVWHIETAQQTLTEWRWKHLRMRNDLSRVANSNTAPNFGDVAASTNFRAAASAYIDFVSNGLNADSGNELGSLLDCNLPAISGIKMEVVGKVTPAVTNGHTVFIGGRRLFGDLSAWQKYS